MSLVQAKCTNCGANLNVENTKDAAICPFCGTPYVVEKAIQNYNINNSTVNVIDTVVMQNGYTPQRYLENGITQIRLSRYKDAEETFMKMSKDYPKDWRAWYALELIKCWARGSINIGRFSLLVPKNIREQIGDGEVYRESDVMYELQIANLDLDSVPSRYAEKKERLENEKAKAEVRIRSYREERDRYLVIIGTYESKYHKKIIASNPNPFEKNTYLDAKEKLSLRDSFIETELKRIKSIDDEIRNLRPQMKEELKECSEKCERIKKQLGNPEKKHTIAYYFKILEESVH
ncbi:hypothetical protein SAMN02910456_00639 [Ruminococcaceae bacterium YRB3002]|nr:hypothetical protein SAMN02910456_00639 [Ruminococcaceae bacterium YRB3002]